MTARSVPEWIGSSPDAKVPPRVRRRAPGSPLTVATFRERSVVDPETGCWNWTGAVHKKHGYGAINIGGRTTRAHRAAFICATGNNGLTPADDVCHRCDNRRCVNPDHLFLGTRKDNMRDCAEKGRIRVPHLVGEDCPASKLSRDQVLAIRVDNRSQRELGRLYGVDKGTIASIKRGKTWRSL